MKYYLFFKFYDTFFILSPKSKNEKKKTHLFKDFLNQLLFKNAWFLWDIRTLKLKLKCPCERSSGGQLVII